MIMKLSFIASMFRIMAIVSLVVFVSACSRKGSAGLGNELVKKKSTTSNSPVVKILSPSNESYINIGNESSSFTVSGTCTSTNPSKLAGQAVSIKVDGQESTQANCNSGLFSGVIDATQLSEGPHLITASVKDLGGTTGTSSANRVIKDITKPTLSIGQPSSANVNAASPTEYLLTFGDTNLGTLSSTTIANGITITGTNTGCSKVITILGNTAKVRISGCSGNGAAGISIDNSAWSDKAGNPYDQSPIANSFVVNNNSPSVAITSLNDGDWIGISSNSSSYNVSGTCTETDQSQLTNQTVTLKDGASTIGSGPCQSNGTFSITINSTLLADGNHSLTAMVTDLSGNKATSPAVGMKKDVVAPTVTISTFNPSSNITYNTTVNFTLTFSDTNLGTLDNALIASAITFNGTGTSTSGCEATVSGSNATNRSVAVTGCNGSGSVTVTVGSGAAKDLAQNPLTAKTSNSSFTVFNVGPAIGIATPAIGSWVNKANDSASFTVTGTCAEANQALLTGNTVDIQVDQVSAGSAVCTGAGTFSGTIDTTGLSEGPHDLTVSVTDDQNQFASATRSFSKDVTEPAIQITGPDSNSPININGSKIYTLSITDTNLNALDDNIIKNAITVTGTGNTGCSVTVKTTNGVTSVTITSCSGNGSAGLSVASTAASDLAGNSMSAGTAGTGFTVNNSTPNLAITAPSNNHWINIANGSTDLTVSGTCTETDQSQLEGQTVNIILDTNSPITTTCDQGAFSKTIEQSQISAGPHTLKATVVDLANNSATTGTLNFTKDVIAPTLMISGPTKDSINSSGSNTFTLSFTDSNLGSLDNDTLANGLSLDGTDPQGCTLTVTGSSATSRTVTITSCSGNGTVFVKASKSIWNDLAGNELSADVNSSEFVVNNTAPTLTITAPAEGSWVNIASNSSAMTISGSCTGPLSNQVNGQQVSLYLDSSSTAFDVQPCSNGVFNSSIDPSALSEGSHSLIAKLQDTAGNNATSNTLNFGKDVTSPTVTISAPSNSGPVNYSSTVTYTLTFSDTNIGNITNSRIDLATTFSGNSSGCTATASGTGTTRTVSVTGCNAGSTNIGISIGSTAMSDAAGNPVIAAGPSATFAVANSGPSLTFNTIGSNNYINIANDIVNLTVSGTCTAPSQQLINGRVVTLKVDNVSVATPTCNSGTFSATVNVKDLSEGTLIFNASATDSAGNSASVNRTVIKDVTKPTVSISGPAGNVVANSNSTTTYNLTFADTNLPTLNQTTISNGITLNGSATGCSKQVALNDATTATVTITGCAGSGTVTITVDASALSDLAGNTLTASTSDPFTVNNTAPTLAITTPSNNSYINSTNNTSTFVVNGTCTGPTQSVVNGQAISISVDGVNKSNPTCTSGAFSTTVDVTGLSTGNHTISASITDASSLSASSSVTVNKDVTAPNAASTLAWTNGTTSTLASQPITWTKSTSGDLSNQKIQIYSSTNCSVALSLIDLASSTATSYTYTVPTSGSYSFTVVSIDTAGNSNSSACSGNMAVTLPPISLSPGNLSYPSGSPLTLTFVGSGGSGTGYTYSIVSGSGSIDSATGVYTGGTSRYPGGSTVVRVTDSVGATASSTITHLGTLVNGTVLATVNDGTNMYVGGTFTRANPIPTTGLLPVHSTSGNVLNSTIATGFNAGATINTVLESGEFIFVGGSFTSYNGTTIQNLAKINRNTGILDTTFTQTTGPNTAVYALALNGTNLFVGGAFTNYRGAALNNVKVMKLNSSSGVIDTSYGNPFTISNSYAGTVYSLLIANSSLYVGGDFQGANGGVSGNSLIKMSLTTGTASVLNGTTSPAGAVYALATNGNGALYVGGAMSSWRGSTGNVDSTKKYLLKLDWNSGAVDTGFNQSLTNPNPDNTVRSLAVSSDGNHLFVGGDFTKYRNDAKGAYLAKVSTTTGDLETTSFNNQASNSGPNNSVLSVGLSTDGSALFVGGRFTTYRNDTKGAYIAKVSASSGVLDTSNFNANALTLDGNVSSVLVTANGIYAGGTFTTYRGTPVQNIAKFSMSNWALDTTFSQSTGANNTVRALALSGGSLFIGGDFLSYRGSFNAMRLAKIDTSTGALDGTFNASTIGPSGTVNAIAIYGSSLYIGGSFLTYRTELQKASYLTKVSTSTGAIISGFVNTNSQLSHNPDGVVHALAVSSDGSRLYVGGAFTNYRSSQSPRLVSVNSTDGTITNEIPSGTSTGNVLSIVVNGSSLFIGGTFTQMFSNPRAYKIAKLNKGASTFSFDTTFGPSSNSSGPDLDVNAIAVSSTGSSVFIGGTFTNYRGDTKGYYVAKLSGTNGTLNTTFNSTANTGPNASVNSLSISSDGSKLFVGGAFTSYRSDRNSPALISVDTATGLTSW